MSGRRGKTKAKENKIKGMKSKKRLLFATPRYLLKHNPATFTDNNILLQK
ncbi:hypothetical protein [Plesiomonas shigelloides]|nr:hypothetical protein [Plesiomonas shigelloides]